MHQCVDAKRASLIQQVGRKPEAGMRPWFPLLAAACLALLAATSAHAQFYSPDTEFHDRVQRHFVVELARVLAWRENQKDPAHPAIAEVTYDVGISPDRKTTWNVHWLNSSGTSDTDGVRRLISAGLLKDKDSFEKAYHDPKVKALEAHSLAWGIIEDTLIQCMRNDMEATPVPKDRDLMPPGAQSLAQAVQAAVANAKTP